VRNVFANTFFELAQTDDKLCAVVADISPAGSMSKFREQFPDRFINTGVAEQIMIGLVAGMARRGLKPFAYTIATFTLFRPYEFIRDDLCYQNLPVTVVGIGGGLTYSTLGATHHAMEDVGLASTLPNMQVISPCDPEEVREVTLWCAQQTNGPVYLRLAKAGEPILTKDAVDPWRFGKIRYIRRGTDVCLLTYGAITKMTIQVADRMAADGLSVSVVSVHTLKPLDREGIATALHSHSHVAVIEEMLPNGGLAGNVKQIAWDSGARCRLDTFTLKDEFIHCYGNHDQLLAAHGLSVDAIYARMAA
jgi:transketolase